MLTADGGGGYSESWQAYATVWADLHPARGRETLSMATSYDN